MRTDTLTTTQVYRVYIKATPQAIWDAITDPAWTEKYGYTNRADYELRPGGAYRSYPSEAMKRGADAMGFTLPEVVVDGEVLESDPPHRLVQTWRMLMDPEAAEEGFTRLTYEIAETKGGVTKLTVTHELEGAPKLALVVAGRLEETGAGGGWAWVLSDLKSLLETGAPMDMEDGLKR
ncbi:MAG TPA: SRPBCC family protein [Actinomycetota bacterium]|nr:SRPBCC family protein [Actinomycetota bacterium]